MQPADLALVSVDHIYQALGTIERIEELGLYIDPIPVHWIFHPDNGFTLIDFDHPFDCPTKAGNDPLHFLRYLLQEIELDNAPMPGLLDALMGLEQRTKTACHMRYPAGSSVLNRVMTVLDGITAKRALCAQGIFSPDIVDDYLDAYMTTLRG